MRIAVTGAAGFLGSHVADTLVEAGHEVWAVDQRATGRHRTVEADLLDADAIAASFRGADAVCHLAAVGDVYLAADRPALAAAVNVTGTANVCEAALKEKVKRVVIASTWEVYGHPHYQPLDETHPTDPDHPYNITKLAGEQLGRAYARLKGLDLVALRLGTAYGTRMRPNSVIQGSGEQGRQFTHASDIARAFEAALTRGSSGEAYNVVAERMISIRELAETVRRITPTQVTYGPPRPGDVPSATVSSARAKADLGWSATMPFDRGLAEIIEEIRAVPAAARA